MALTFSKAALMKFNGTPVTDHNRSPLEINTERIERRVRLANGATRTYHVATKRLFSVSWEMVPTLDAETVDGFMAAQGIEDFYDSTTSSFTLGITEKGGSTTNYTVLFDSSGFSKTVVKRWDKEYWNLSVTMTEV